MARNQKVKRLYHQKLINFSISSAEPIREQQTALGRRARREADLEERGRHHLRRFDRLPLGETLG